MKKKLVFLVFMLFTCANLVAQDCSIYHKGFFTFTDSTGTTILVQRKNKYQYQYDRNKKIRTQYRITWIDDCTYTITQTLTNSKAQREYKNYTSKTIISKMDGKNGYYYECACTDGSQIITDAYMKKISKEEFYKLY
jgi:hypothetical protein